MLISTENTEDFWAKLLSLPSWERGLKPKKTPGYQNGSESLPSWERGLKQRIFLRGPQTQAVAPLVGAWIETYLHFTVGCAKRSLPSWERGLKQWSSGTQGR